MASTFTNNLLLENATPLDPAQRNVWGTTENTGRTLVDAAVAGIQPLNLPAQTGYPTVILTSSQGQPDQARNAHFVFSGTLTANTLVLFPQSRNRMFTVNNTATGAFTVTVGVNNGSGAAAGTTVVVPQGQSVNLFSDGTNVATRVNGVVGGLTVSGGETVDNLTVSGSATYPNPTVGGTANAIALTYPVTPAGNVQGAKYVFKAAAANTGATTVAINGGTAKNIFKKTASGASACIGGEIQNGDIVEIEYDGTQYQIMNGTVGLSGPTSAVSGNIATFNGTSGSAIQDSGVSPTVLMPPGVVLPYTAATAPTGWLLANGQAVSRTTYATLYAALGGASSPYGQGDGSTTFNVPDMRGRVVAGYDPGNATGRLSASASGGASAAALGNVGGEQAHALTGAENGPHAHNFLTNGDAAQFIDAGQGGVNGLTGTGSALGVQTTATASAGSGTAHNTVQPTFILNYIIKT